MFRDERQARLNELLVRLQDAADLAAHGPGAEDLAALAPLAAWLRARAEPVAAAIRAGGELPDAPDLDRQGVREIRLRVEGFAFGDRQGALLGALDQALRQALAACRAAEEELPEAGLCLEIEGWLVGGRW